MSITITLKFVPKGPINKNLALFQIMAWRLLGDKPLSIPMLFSLLTHRPQWVKVYPWYQYQGHPGPFYIHSQSMRSKAQSMRKDDVCTNMAFSCTCWVLASKYKGNRHRACVISFTAYRSISVIHNGYWISRHALWRPKMVQWFMFLNTSMNMNRF